VIVGVLDTGIWPEHPSFSDPDPAGKAYPPPAVPHQCQFDIGDHPGPDFACNKKLIGAYRFLAAYDACVGAGGCTMPAAAFTSARDENGHGTHTASTAAGNAEVPATLLGIDRGRSSGIAPRAQVIATRCAATTGVPGDCAAAVDQAILDGVDVINFSIGGGTRPTRTWWSSPSSTHTRRASSSPPPREQRPERRDGRHRGPWVTTVGASSQKRSSPARSRSRAATARS
jgi:subtilisin family serine protease